MKIINFLGLILVTLGALLAIFAAPGPSYLRNGNVQLGPAGKSGPEFLAYRIRRHYLQKYGLPASFGMIALGSLLQIVSAASDL